MVLWQWKHWFWITKATMSARWPIYVLLVAQLMAIATDALPIGAVDTKSIMFKKFALNDDAKGSDKPNLPVVAAAMRSTTGSSNINGSPEQDGLGDVMDGHEEISRIFVTLPTTSSTTTTIQSTTSKSTVENVEKEKEKEVVSVTPHTLLPSDVEKTKNINRSAETESSNPLITRTTLTKDVEKESETEELLSVQAEAPAAETIDGTIPARLIQVSINASDAQEGELRVSETENELTVSSIPSMSIEETDKKIDNENIQNLVLQEDDELDAFDLNNSNSNRSRKSKGLIDNQTNKNLLARSTGTDEETRIVANPAAQLQPAESQNLNRSPNLLIQFSDSDKLELLNSQNHALTSDDGSPRTRSSNFGLISGISFSVLALFCTVSLIGAMMYRRRYVNKPQTLSEPDSSGYIDDSIIRDNSDEMYSLDNDSFLNSLEAMTIQNYWTDHVKHTKL